MKYLVIEIQTDAGGNVSNIVSQFEDLEHAQSAYYSILAAAAISSVPTHAANLMDNEGTSLLSQSFAH